MECLNGILLVLQAGQFYNDLIRGLRDNCWLGNSSTVNAVLDNAANRFQVVGSPFTALVLLGLCAKYNPDSTFYVETVKRLDLWRYGDIPGDNGED